MMQTRSRVAGEDRPLDRAAPRHRGSNEKWAFTKPREER